MVYQLPQTYSFACPQAKTVVFGKGLEIAGTQGFNILKSSLYGFAIHV